MLSYATWSQDQRIVMGLIYNKNINYASRYIYLERLGDLLLKHVHVFLSIKNPQ